MEFSLVFMKFSFGNVVSRRSLGRYSSLADSVHGDAFNVVPKYLKCDVFSNDLFATPTLRF
jgi:hypothetical protein